MLIILLSAGNGLKNGVTANMGSRAKNYLGLSPGWTAKPYRGLPTGRRIRFDQRDYDMLRREIPEIDHLSARIRSSQTISYGEEYVALSLEGGTADLEYIANIKMKDAMGRFINRIDDADRRKVIVIHPNHQKVLFKDEDPIGKYVTTADGIVFQVVGVYGASDQFNSNDPPAYVPLSTAQMLYNRGWGFSRIEFTALGLTTMAENEAFNERLRQKIGNLHMFDPADRSALYLRNDAESALRNQQVFKYINFFLVIIGLASMMAGIVGVGNIMYISVKERTREIGIRKAIGAKSGSILSLVILESIFITISAGYIGIVLGVGVTELFGDKLSTTSDDGQISMFLDPGVELSTILWATLLLVVCGVVAGLIPSLKATRVSPIEAMRAE